MKIRPIKQRDASACAPTCIDMVLTYFKIPHTAKQISEVTKYKKSGGLYNKQIVDAIKKFGLKTIVYKNASWEKLIELNQQNTAIVVSWMLDGYIGHVSVVEKVDEKHIYLAEPTQGKILRMQKLKFLRLWLDYEAKEPVPWYPESKANIQLRWMVVASR